MTMIVITENLGTKITRVIYRYPSVDTMKLGKTLKNMSNVLAKPVKKSIFSKKRLASLLMKKRTSFPSKICTVF